MVIYIKLAQKQKKASVVSFFKARKQGNQNLPDSPWTEEASGAKLTEDKTAFDKWRAPIQGELTLFIYIGN